MIKQNRLLFIGGTTVLSIVVAAGLFFAYQKRFQIQFEKDALIVEIPVEQEYPYSIGPGSTLYSVLRDLNIAPQTIQKIVEASKPVYSLSRVMPSTRFNLTHKIGETPGADSELVGIKFRMSPIDIVEIKVVNGAWVAEKLHVAVDMRVVTFKGVVGTTLWESAENAQMDPNLISDLAEIFAWQVDFAREVRVNDRWRLSVEQKIVQGRPIGWGRIVAAEYENSGQLYSAVLFRVGDQDMGYFAPDGSSLRRMFLKSPLRFGRISSSFQKARFHPILKVFRAHLGVDYAAPKGTPVHAVGNGVVTMSSWNGGAGNVIKIRHNSTYDTAYKHLSGFAPSVRKGARVQQGQVIGYVGSTGLSTAPHLHFEFYQNGVYVNPQGRKFPSADPVPANLLSQFQALAVSVAASLPPWGESAATMDGSAAVQN